MSLLLHPGLLGTMTGDFFVVPGVLVNDEALCGRFNPK